MAIPNILFKPHQATANAKAPALVCVHGGPGGQTTRNYSAILQYLANHGYVVLGINNRGSSGYGKSFHAADDQKHGREPIWDCVEPDVFDVGVDIFGVSNWLRTLENRPAWHSKEMDVEIGDPATQKELLREISPIFHADKIRKPLIVLQGANDPRHQGRVRRHRRRGEAERRPDRVHPVPRRGPGVQQARQRDRGLRRDPAVPRRAPQGQGQDQAGGPVRGTAAGATAGCRPAAPRCNRADTGVP
jgi:hypothetical protein